MRSPKVNEKAKGKGNDNAMEESITAGESIVAGESMAAGGSRAKGGT